MPAPPLTSALSLSDLSGTWTRRLLREPDGRRDTTTRVTWVQAGPLRSAGRYVATTHRVRKVAEERCPFPLFFSVDSATVVGPLSAERGGEGMTAGEHLSAQTAQTSTYLRERVARGELVLPPGARPLHTSGRVAS